MRQCTICGHDEAHAINVALVQREPYRHIATRFGVSTGALQRHSREHVPKLLVEAKEAVERAAADDLLEELRTISENLERLSRKAEEDEDYRTAIGGQSAQLKRLELLAKVRQIISDAPQVHLHLSQEWVELRAVIVTALEPHPEARESVMRALEGASNGGA